MTYKIRIFILFALVLLLSCEDANNKYTLEEILPTAESVTQYKTYLPMVVISKDIVVDERSGPEVCMAWSGRFLEEAERDFGSTLYYHSGTWRIPSDRAIPIVRSLPGQRQNIAEQLLYLKSINWNGLVILANEPDMKDQDAVTRPQDMAGLYWYATQVLPDATFIVPNTIDLNYLDEFLDFATIRTKDRIGIHIYQGNALDEVHTWPLDWVSRLQTILYKHNVQNKFWISEVGIAESWTFSVAKQYTDEIFSTQAEVACVYTTTCGAYIPGCGWDLYSQSGILTIGGNALKETLGR